MASSRPPPEKDSKALWEARYGRSGPPSLRKAIRRTALSYKARRWFWIALFAAIGSWLVLEQGEVLVQAKAMVDQWVVWAAAESKGYGPGR